MVFNGECLVADGLPRKDGSMGPGSPLFIRAVFVKLETYLEVFFSRRKNKLWKTIGLVSPQKDRAVGFLANGPFHGL